MSDITRWLATGQAVAVATVVETWGSAPRSPGSTMAVSADGGVAGSVSGGCVESAVVVEALDSIETGRPRLLRFGVTDDDALAVGLSCGGEIAVLVEPWPDDGPQRALRESVAADLPVAASVSMAERSLARRLTVTTREPSADVPPGATGTRDAEDGLAVGSLGDEALDRAAVAAARRTLAERRSGHVIDLHGSPAFVAAYPPRDKLVIVGAVHIAQSLARLAGEVGFRVTVADSRESLATRERFPDVDHIEVGRPSQVLGAVGLDESTYVAVLTHDPKLDDPAIVSALDSAVPYIGVLGSRQTHAARVARLSAIGVPDEQLRRLRAPIGLDLGASTPDEIAVSILAEIVAARHGR